MATTPGSSPTCASASCVSVPSMPGSSRARSRSVEAEQDTPHRLRREPARREAENQRERRGGDGLLLVHAHPDDECFSTGGLIARSIAEGKRVDLVTCTGGEEGEIHDPDLDPDEAKPRLREIRREELECSVRALGS